MGRESGREIPMGRPQNKESRKSTFTRRGGPSGSPATSRRARPVTERTMRFPPGDTLGQDLMLPKKEVKVPECLDSVVISARRLWRPREHGMCKSRWGPLSPKGRGNWQLGKTSVEVKWGEAREAWLKGSGPPKGCGGLVTSVTYYHASLGVTCPPPRAPLMSGCP